MCNATTTSEFDGTKPCTSAATGSFDSVAQYVRMPISGNPCFHELALSAVRKSALARQDLWGAFRPRVSPSEPMWVTVTDWPRMRLGEDLNVHPCVRGFSVPGLLVT